jgi:OmpA-OmpF porin, OOP family
VPNDDKKKHGCPEAVERKDSDGDGIFDDEDACVKDPGKANADKKKHGCPSKDSDGDGIFDDEDACVQLPGDPNEDPNLNGCPPPDTDGDGILDADDACVSDPGKPNDDPKKHGCPKAKIEGKQVKILERIEFDSAKATLRPESDEVLQAVLDVLTAHPELRKLSIEGHTDNRGARAFNTNLSRKRAEAVRLWLIERGIEAERLSAAGFGPDKPIDDNDSDEGRQNNRRVEFHITEQDSSSTEIEETP